MVADQAGVYVATVTNNTGRSFLTTTTLIYAGCGTSLGVLVLTAVVSLSLVGSYYWLVAELDKKKQIAFGYANLNDDDLAEWGYISIGELTENGARADRDWSPCSSREAIARIRRERGLYQL